MNATITVIPVHIAIVFRNSNILFLYQNRQKTMPVNTTTPSKKCPQCEVTKTMDKYIKRGNVYSNNCRACIVDDNKLERENKLKREKITVLRKEFTKQANAFGRVQSNLTSGELLKKLGVLTTLVEEIKQSE